MLTLDVSAHQEPLLLLDVPKGPKLHVALFRLQKPVLLLDLSTLQRPELHLDVSARQSLTSTWTCLFDRSPLNLSLWRYKNSVHEKNHGILLNFVQLCDTEIREVLRIFLQFRTKYGRDGSTITVGEKTYRFPRIL